MKCKYIFSIEGRIRPNATFPVAARGWLFEFKTMNGLATHIEVTVPLPQQEDWPQIQEKPTEAIKLHIDTNSRHLPMVQRELRALQGLLAIYGLHSINLDNPKQEWIPESDEERDLLPLFSYSSTLEPIPSDQIVAVPFSLIACAIFAAEAATDKDVPLNFFRRGMLDVYSRNYIEAIYDFYFILESEFGEGKFKQAEILTAFLSSNSLVSFVQQAISDPSLMLQSNASIRTQFTNSYGKLTVKEALDKIIKLRGDLHHHTVKRRDNWHPEDQHRYEIDALFMQSVTFNAIFSIVDRYLSDVTVLNQYEELCLKHTE